MPRDFARVAEILPATRLRPHPCRPTLVMQLHKQWKNSGRRAPPGRSDRPTSWPLPWPDQAKSLVVQHSTNAALFLVRDTFQGLRSDLPAIRLCPIPVNWAIHFELLRVLLVGSLDSFQTA